MASYVYAHQHCMELHKLVQFVDIQMPSRSTEKTQMCALHTDIPSPYIQSHLDIVRVLRRDEPGAGVGVH